MWSTEYCNTHVTYVSGCGWDALKTDVVQLTGRPQMGETLAGPKKKSKIESKRRCLGGQGLRSGTADTGRITERRRGEDICSIWGESTRSMNGLGLEKREDDGSRVNTSDQRRNGKTYLNRLLGG